jgi:UDP-glucuronate 4-epimerase
MKNILLTGNCGFIGTHISIALLKDNYRVIGIDNMDDFYDVPIKKQNLETQQAYPNFKFIQADLRFVDDLLLIDEPIDIILHFAGKAGIKNSVLHPEQFIENNISGTQHLLNWAHKKGVKKMIFASSSSVYGNNRNMSFGEDDICDTPISPYAFTKKACELLNFTHHYLYNVDIINLRFFTVYGPRQRPDLVIRKFVEQIKSNQSIMINGDGKASRDYTFIDDAVQGILSALKYIEANENVYETFNIGTGISTTINEIANIIYSEFNIMPQIINVEPKREDSLFTCANITKAQKMLGYYPTFNIETGITRFINWHEENY